MMAQAFRSGLVAALLAGCSPEFQISSRPKIPPAEPPGDPFDEQGEPPDWQNCPQGWRGLYSNLRATDAFVNPRPNEEPAPTTPEALALWDRPGFEKFDPTLDFGQNWWPVDDGLAGDPAYFAVYWHAWIRAWSDTTLSFSMGASDDAWVYVNGTPIAEEPGIHDFVRQTYDVQLDAGQYPIEVWYAHRGSDVSGFSFRVLTGDASICYPDFGTTAQANP